MLSHARITTARFDEMYGLDEEVAMLRESAADMLRKAVYA